MKRNKFALVMVIGLLSAGVAGAAFPPITIVRSASDADDAKAKLFEPDAARALVYVFRDKALVGGDIESQFVVNNVSVAKNEKGRFNVISLAPGSYEFLSLTAKESMALNTMIHNSRKKAVPLTAEAGKIYYFQEVFKPLGGFSLKDLPADKAQPLIKKGKLLSNYRQ